MITKKQAAFLRSLQLDGRLAPLDPCRRRLADEINKANPDTVCIVYGGSVGGSKSEFPGYLTYRAQHEAIRLLREYEETEIVGYSGTVRVVSATWKGDEEQEYHYRAKTPASLKTQLKRGLGYRRFEIITMDPYTHAQWCMAFGYGKM
jgi:hypothetical protein